MSGNTWPARTGPHATLYGNPEFVAAEAAMHFESASQYALVPLNTDGAGMPMVTYTSWMKVPAVLSGNLGWAISQYPDHGWSRAITLNDHRLSSTTGVSIVTGSSWSASLPKPTPGTWFFTAATWDQGSQSCVSMDGGAKQCSTANNGHHPSTPEKLVIGGRGPDDGGPSQPSPRRATLY